MNSHRSALPIALLTALLILHPSSFILAQGSLTPPGAPAPTLKTLDQVEARTPIGSAPFTISTSGSYYLTGNLAVTTGNAITISVDNVTVDLNGFTLSSTASPASGVGVSVSGVRRNVTIQNGHIRGTTTFAAGAFTPGGFQHGIINGNSTSTNLRVVEVNVSSVAGEGIELSEFTSTAIVERCTVDVCGSAGIRAGTVRDCSVRTAGAFGVSGITVAHTTAESVGTSTLFSGIAATLVECSRGVGAAGDGITGTTVSYCTGVSASRDGISATHVNDSTGSSTTGSGVTAAMAINCFGSAATAASGAGLRVTSTASFCRGSCDGGLAMNVTNAIGCSVAGTGVISATNRFLGTP